MLTILITVGAMAAQPTPAPPPPAPLPQWIAGAWISQDSSGQWWEEWWTRPRAGIMFGASRSGKGDALSFFEQMRIERDTDGLSFCAQPKGQAGGCFRAVSATDRQIVFENPAHDYPTRIVYQREGAELVAEISGPNGSRLVTWRFKPAD